jgi:hypothetical protein
LNNNNADEKLKKLLEYFKEAREIRRRYAN